MLSGLEGDGNRHQGLRRAVPRPPGAASNLHRPQRHPPGAKLRKAEARCWQLPPRWWPTARSLLRMWEFSLRRCGPQATRIPLQVIEAAIAAGATTIQHPDTVGYINPQ